ncbi:HAMP domain-containing histidine kinase [bacterium]|nr:HAMP domain-containing histidine kinase [bacterium]
MVDPFSRQEARAGLEGITAIGIGYFLFLILSMLWQSPFSWGLFFNRLVSLGIYCWARWQYQRQRIAAEHYCGWSLGLGCLGLLSLAVSYWLGFKTHVSARITVMIVFCALVGVPPLYYSIYLGLCLITCVLLQRWFPIGTESEVNLAVPIVGLVLSISIFAARRRIGRILFNTSQELEQRRSELEQTLAQAQRLGSSLDSDVSRATWALQNTNEQLQKAIQEQIRSFDLNQKLQRETGEKQRHQALGKAAGAAAHDLNNLLAVISGSLEVLEEELSCPEGSEPRRLVAELNQELSRCVQVGREVLMLSGRYLLRKVDFELGNWLGQVIGTLPSGLLPEKIRLTINHPEPSWVCCDQSQLQSALLKLLSNARESSPTETVQVCLERLGSDVLVLVEDRGAGVSDKMLAVLFEPFSTDKNPILHPGLGLAAARSMLRQQGGDVFYSGRPEPGLGARFGLKLPARGSLD